MSDLDHITGRTIAAARTLAGLTQAELASAANISVSTLKRMEASDAGPGEKVAGLSNNVRAVVAALVASGVVFTPGNGIGPGVALAKPSAD